MTYVPTDELKSQHGLTFAPMVDFLFLMLAFFASLAVSHLSMHDTNVQLVNTNSAVLSSDEPAHSCKRVHISILDNGNYVWNTEVGSHSLGDASEIAKELLKQHEKGILPKDKKNTKILLNIDKNAKWEPILKALVSIREAGFEVHPLFQKK